MWKISMVIRILSSRKFRRLFISVFVLTIIVILVSIIAFFDITCIPRSYKPKISLKKSFVNKLNRNSLNQKWSPIVDNIISIYSAFYYKNQIIIIGIIDQNFIELDFYCELKQNNGISKIKAKNIILPESWSEFYNFVSVKVICNITEITDSDSVKVSFKHNKQLLETSYKSINQISDKNIHFPETPIVVCVRPLFGPFTSSAELLEFIAYYRVNGIQRFIFYDLSISDDIKHMLLNMPFVQLLSYNLPIDSSDIHADGQIAALNDCVLRYSNNIVIHVDIDELIVPSHKYTDIKGFVDCKAKNPLIGALVVPNVMICDEFNQKYDFPRILNATVRQTSKWEHRDRSKAIILKPLSIQRLGIHTVWNWTDLTLNENVQENDAMLFHYRSCCRVWQPFYHNNFLGINLFFLSYNDRVVNDFSIKRYETKIIEFLRDFIDF